MNVARFFDRLELVASFVGAGAVGLALLIIIGIVLGLLPLKESLL